MKIGVISDTHGDIKMGRKAIGQLGTVDLILLAGDHFADAEKLRPYTSAEIIAVRGNVEPKREGPAELILEYEGVKIFMTHGHHYDVKHSLQRLYYRAKEMQVQVVIFGHTHIALNAVEDGILFLNPGSVSRPKGWTGNSYAILELHDEKPSAKILEIV